MGYPIEIGENVRVGGGAIILPDVKIGENSIVAAGSVVTKAETRVKSSKNYGIKVPL